MTSVGLGFLIDSLRRDTGFYVCILIVQTNITHHISDAIFNASALDAIDYFTIIYSHK